MPNLGETIFHGMLVPLGFPGPIPLDCHEIGPSVLSHCYVSRAGAQGSALLHLESKASEGTSNIHAFYLPFTALRLVEGRTMLCISSGVPQTINGGAGNEARGVTVPLSSLSQQGAGDVSLLALTAFCLVGAAWIFGVWVQS